jgi:hypothetical protein
MLPNQVKSCRYDGESKKEAFARMPGQSLQMNPKQRKKSAQGILSGVSPARRT